LAIGTLHLVCRALSLHATCHLEISSPETLVHYVVQPPWRHWPIGQAQTAHFADVPTPRREAL